MLLVDNSVLKMYLLQSQLSLKIKSVTFIVIIYLYLPGKAKLSLLVAWTGINEHIDILYLMLKSTSHEYKMLLTSEVGKILVITDHQLLSSEPSPFPPDEVILSCTYRRII
jgi:hypothetical protein